MDLVGQPGRSESCLRCRSDLRVCLNCRQLRPAFGHQCRDRRADPVAEKHLGNYCEYFEFTRRDYVPPANSNPRESSARDALRKLFGDCSGRGELREP